MKKGNSTMAFLEKNVRYSGTTCVVSTIAVARAPNDTITPTKWDDTREPIVQMNLSESQLLQVHKGNQDTFLGHRINFRIWTDHLAL